MQEKRIEFITSKDNECIKRLKKLHDKKHREETGSFLVEGIKIVKELLAYIPEHVRLLVFSQEAVKKYAEFYKICLECLKVQKIKKIIQVTEKISEYISTTESSQGVYAEVLFNDKDIILLKNHKNVVVIDSIQDPGNLGTIIRSIDAFGFDNVLTLDGTADIYNPKVIRSSMGSIFHLSLFKDIKRDKLINFLKENQYKIYATTPYGNVDIDELILDERFAIIIGNESRGVDDFFKKEADKQIKISMRGKAESLNAAIAASIILYELNKKLKPSSY